MKARIGARHLIGDLPRAVRRGVIDDEHLEPRILRQHLRHNLREVRRLVVIPTYNEATSARSATPASQFQHGRDDERRYDEEQREEPDNLPSRERARVVAQLELLGTRSDRDREERVITTQDLSRVAIDADAPVEIPVFRDEHVARVTWWRLEVDGHLPRIPRGHASARRGCGRQTAQRRWSDRSGSRK